MPPWSPGYPSRLKADEVAVFRIPIPDIMPIGVLSAEEIARAARFMREVDRIRFSVSHIALREILAWLLDGDPAAMQFETGPWGKPAVRGVEFNLSHSGALALVALSPNLRLGVDVEEARPVEIHELAHRTFHPEEAVAVFGEADFFRFWSLKEAFMKATGRGFHLSPDRFLVSRDDPPRLLWADDEPTRDWTLMRLPIDAGYEAALAVAGRPGRVTTHTWRAGAGLAQDEEHPPCTT